MHIAYSCTCQKGVDNRFTDWSLQVPGFTRHTDYTLRLSFIPPLHGCLVFCSIVTSSQVKYSCSCASVEMMIVSSRLKKGKLDECLKNSYIMVTINWLSINLI